MRGYQIGLYEKAMPSTMSWREKLSCAKECGYDYVEMTIDATDDKIARVRLGKEERDELVKTMLEVGLPIRSMSVSALTKYALGDIDADLRKRGEMIIEKAIILAADLGVRIVMIPGYDIYFGESTPQTTRLFIDNIKRVAELGAKYGVTIGIETMENEFTNTTAKVMYYVELVNSPYLQVYPDTGNITNGNLLYNKNVCGDLRTGAGHVGAMHLKESKPGLFREIPHFTGHVDFENLIKTAWEMGVRRYVTELWDTGKKDWKEDIVFANRRKRWKRYAKASL